MSPAFLTVRNAVGKTDMDFGKTDILDFVKLTFWIGKTDIIDLVKLTFWIW